MFFFDKLSVEKRAERKQKASCPKMAFNREWSDDSYLSTGLVRMAKKIVDRF